MQFIVSNIFKFQNYQCPDYFDKYFCPVGENSVIKRSSKKKKEKKIKATFSNNKNRNPKPILCEI